MSTHLMAKLFLALLASTVPALVLLLLGAYAAAGWLMRRSSRRRLAAAGRRILGEVPDLLAITAEGGVVAVAGTLAVPEPAVTQHPVAFALWVVGWSFGPMAAWDLAPDLVARIRKLRVGAP